DLLERGAESLSRWGVAEVFVLAEIHGLDMDRPALEQCLQRGEDLAVQTRTLRTHVLEGGAHVDPNSRARAGHRHTLPLPSRSTDVASRSRTDQGSTRPPRRHLLQVD